MFLKSWAVPLATAAVAMAIANKQMCGDVSDIADTNPTCRVEGVPSRFEPAVFNVSKWIWTGENLTPGGVNPAGVRPFRKNILSPCGKCATCATVVIASDDTYTLFVNGKQLGAGVGWKTGRVFFTALNPSSNLFAIAGGNVGGPAAVMATIHVHYSDGTHDTYITDETWRTLRGAPPNNFQLPSTVDTNWPFSTLQGTWDLSGIWGKPALPPVLPLAQSKWIWASNTDVGPRALRKTVSDCTKVAVCATVLVASDDHYTLYVNGQFVGKDTKLLTADAYTVPKLHPTYNVFAVQVTNDIGPAAFIATILITYRDGTTSMIVTDGTWKASNSVVEGFERIDTDDAGWEAARIINYGVPATSLIVPPA